MKAAGIVLKLACIVAVVLCIAGAVAPEIFIPFRPLWLNRLAAKEPIGPSTSPAKSGPESPMIGALDSTLQEYEKELDRFGDQMRSELAQADGLYQQAKRKNREAIQQSNRRTISRRTSPHLLLVLVQGLTTEGLHCLNPQAKPTPGYDSFAERGVRLTRFEPTGSRGNDHWTSLVDGGTSVDAARPLSLVSLMWYAGYDTLFAGDASRFIGDVRALRFDHWYGFRTSKEASERFPGTVWIDGEETRPGATPEKSKGKASHQMILEEVINSQMASPAQSRPVFALISLRCVGWTSREQDEIPTLITSLLKQTKQDESTIVMIAGIPDDALSAIPNAGALPFFASWPKKISSGIEITEPTRWPDIAATICDFAGASLRRTSLRGRSQRNDWRRPAFADPGRTAVEPASSQ